MFLVCKECSCNSKFKNPVDATPNIDQIVEYHPYGALYIRANIASIKHKTLELDQRVFLSFPCKDSCGKFCLC